jgi:pimeloyl-ACP methyl ester carboxylesterase
MIYGRAKAGRMPCMITRLPRTCLLLLTVLLSGPPNVVAAENSAPRGATTNTAGVQGMEMHYVIQGEGEPLLLLHGFNGSHTAWRDFMPEWSRRYKVIAPDLRGHGRSTNPSGEFTHRQSGRDVLALLDHLGIKTTRAMGISTGGMTLLHAATQDGGRIEAMVLIGATIYFPEEARRIMRRSTVESLASDDFERLRRTHLNGDEQIKALRRQFHGFKDSYEDMNFTAPYLATITARTLIIHGDRDEFFPVNIPVEMYRSIPRSSLWIVPNGGHVPIHGPAKSEFERVTAEFLARPVR